VVPTRDRRRGSGAADDPELAALRRALRAHPCHGCNDREDHARWSERHSRLKGETEQLERKVAATTHSLARAFDRITTLLTERGYLTREKKVTQHGKRLARIYGESDLLVAECLRQELWRDLEAPELAAVVSSLVYEARRDAGFEPNVPGGAISDALTATARLWTALEEDERRVGVERTRSPDAGFAWPVYRWARGEGLERVLTAAESAGQELSAGDFVRWCRQVIDLLDQIRTVMGGDDPVGATASLAVTALRRGVVALGPE
jgi:ATP-dependent RNA helicase HelY